MVLLLRSRFAVHAFALSLVGSVANNLAGLLVSDGQLTAGGADHLPRLLCLVACSAWMARRGVLR